MESNYKGEIKIWDIDLPCALLAVEGRQAPDSQGKLSKFIKLSDFKTQATGPQFISHQRLKKKKQFLVRPKLISASFGGATKRKFLGSV